LTTTLERPTPVRPGLRRQDVDGHRGGLAAHHAAAVLRQADLRLAVLDLAVARLAAKLPEDLRELRAAGGSDGVALREQPAARVHRDLSGDLRDAVLDELAAIADLAESQLL